MSTDAPQRTDVRLAAAWPPVRFVERTETRREHATMAGLMLLATAAFLLVQPAGYVAGAVLTAFVGGVAVQNWLSYPYVHGNGGEE